MKLPFSYRSEFFGSTLFVSFVGHVLFLGVGTVFFLPEPEFSVRQAPSSMEVVLIQERELPRNPKPLVLTTAAPTAKSTGVEKQKENRPEPAPSVAIPPIQGALESQPSYLENPSPVYPRLARENGWEGTVFLRVGVGRDGRVQEVTIDRSSGYPILDEAAIKALRQWLFLPARLGQSSFFSWIKIPVRFLLVSQEVGQGSHE